MSAAELLRDRINASDRPAATDVISIDERRLSGEPCFRGTRVPIKNLFDYLEGGDSLDDFLTGFPGVTREQAVAVLELAGQYLIRNLNSREDPHRS